MVFRVGSSVDDIQVFKWLYRDGQLSYEDNRSAPEYLQTFPTQYNFQWNTPSRSAVKHGDNPHVSIEDRVFVECVVCVFIYLKLFVYLYVCIYVVVIK